MNTMDLNQLSHFVETTGAFTEDLFKVLTEYLEYNSNGMRVVVVENLTTLKERIEGGDDILFYASGSPLTLEEFKETILEAFGEEVCEDVFGEELD